MIVKNDPLSSKNQINFKVPNLCIPDRDIGYVLKPNTSTTDLPDWEGYPSLGKIPISERGGYFYDEIHLTAARGYRRAADCLFQEVKRLFRTVK